MEPIQMKSIHHLQSYPVVNDTYDYLSSYYTWAKEKSALINYTCGLAETSVTKIALPVLERFHNQFEQLDSLTDGQLSRIDEKFPVIKKPTKEIISNSLNYCDSTVIKPVTRPIVRTYQGAYNTVQNTKEYAENLRKNGYDYVEHAIQTADHYVDVYLPSDEEIDNEEEEESDEIGEEKPIELVTTRSVLQKTQRRIITKSRKNIVVIQEKAKELIENVLNSLGLLQILLTTGEQVNLLNKEFQLRLENLESLAMASASAAAATATGGASQLHSKFIDSTNALKSSSIYQRLTNVTLYFVSSAGQILNSLYSHLPSNIQIAVTDLYNSSPLNLPKMLSEAKQLFQQIADYLEESLRSHLPLLHKSEKEIENEKEEEREKEDSSPTSSVHEEHSDEENI